MIKKLVMLSLVAAFCLAGNTVRADNHDHDTANTTQEEGMDHAHEKKMAANDETATKPAKKKAKHAKKNKTMKKKEAATEGSTAEG